MSLATLSQCVLCVLGITWNTWQLEQADMQVMSVLALPDETILVGTNLGIYRITGGAGEYAHFTENVIALGNSPRQPEVVYALADTRGESKLLRSTDAGTTWEGMIVPGRAMCLLVDWENPNTIYVGLNQGDVLIRSVDGGAIWEPRAEEIPRDPDMSYGTHIDWIAGSSRYLYIGYSGMDGGFAVSVDGGEHWQAIDPSTENYPSYPVLQVPDLSSPKNAYALSDGAICTTSDGGENWESLSGWRSIRDYLVHPIDPKRQYMVQGQSLAPRIYISDNGGHDWREGHPLPPSQSRFGYSFVRLWPGTNSPGSLYLTFDGYLGRSEDGGTTWAPLYEQTMVLNPYPSMSATNEHLLVVAGKRGSDQIKIWARPHGTDTWQTFGSPPDTLSRMLTVPTDPSTIYGLGSQIYRSDNGGRDWVGLSIRWGGLDVSATGIDKLATLSDIPDHLFAVQDGGYVESRNRGNTWIFHPRSPQPHQIAIGAHGQSIYIMAGDNEPGVSGYGIRYLNAELFRSHDGGDTWENLHFGRRAFGVPEFIAAHPILPGFLYVNTSRGFFISTDDGLSWEWVPELGERDVRRLLFHPAIPSKVYLMGRGISKVADRGLVFASRDAGRTWEDISAGLVPQSRESPWGEEMVISPVPPYTLYVLFGSEALWSYYDADMQWSEEIIHSRDVALLPNYPNPARSDTWIPYSLARDGSLSLRIYDMLGRCVHTQHMGFQPAGVYVGPEYALRWNGYNDDGQRVADGVYFCTLRFQGQTATRKLLIQR